MELVRVLRETKPDRGLPYGVNQYRMQWAAGFPLPEVCERLGGVISIDVWDQGEAIGVGAWETYSCGGIRPQVAGERGGCREATETYVAGEGWEI